MHFRELTKFQCYLTIIIIIVSFHLKRMSLVPRISSQSRNKSVRPLRRLLLPHLRRNGSVRGLLRGRLQYLLHAHELQVLRMRVVRGLRHCLRQVSFMLCVIIIGRRRQMCVVQTLFLCEWGILLCGDDLIHRAQMQYVLSDPSHLSFTIDAESSSAPATPNLP